jgi:RecB family exonuclease
MATEPIDYRHLPPIDFTVERPSRLSQTLVRHANSCPRSAALYLRYKGGVSMEMDRGTALHMFHEWMVHELLKRGEPSLWAPQPGEDAVLAAGEVASMTKSVVDDILNDPANGLVVPAHEAEHARIAAYHLAIGWDIDLANTFLGVERTFVMDVAGWEIRGRIDLLTWPEPHRIEIMDLKTSLAVPDAAEFESAFQPKLYGALVMFGHPIEVAEDGTEVRGEPLGAHLRQVGARQVHPRAKPKWNEDGTVRLVDRTAYWSRKELQDFLHDVERSVRRIERGLDTGDWPARHGAHCSECPAEPECPLPRHLRRFADAIETPEQAAEAMEWAMRMGGRVTATKKEVRKFVETRAEAGGEDRLPVGTDTFGFATSFRKSIKKNGRDTDWAGLEAAVQSPDFRVEDWIIERPVTEFKKLPREAT